MQYSMPPLQPSDRPTSEGSDGSGSDESSSEEEVSYQSCVECSSDAHSVGSDEAYGCESASASDGEAAGEELQQVAAAPRSYRQTASAAMIARLAAFGIRLALAMLDTLGGEFDEREGIVEEELAEGHDLEVTRRHARWFMYRTFVAHRYGYLGKGVRVTLPNCVIAEIRSRFRAPDCDCAWDALATCTEHGYRGHRSY
jgi:hypothetical protein